MTWGRSTPIFLPK